MPTVTVVIPVFNDARMLERALDALAGQTRPPDEIVVVDNGCTDDSAAIARRGGSRVIFEPMRGILAATARGFDAAGGDIIARIDADSRPPSTWVERIIAAFRDDPGLTAVTGTGMFYDGRRWVRILGRHLYLGGYFLWLGLLLGHPPLYGSNFALRASAWVQLRDRIRRTDPRVHDDLEISFHLPPDAIVRFDPALTVPVSARPFDSVRGTARRVGWGFRTIWVNRRQAYRILRRRVASRNGCRRASDGPTM